MTDFHPAKPEPPALRVGTAEREQAATSLGEHFAAGRLDVTEYDERVARAYAAKTTVELAELFTDLPQPVAVEAQPVERARSRPLPNPILPIGILAVLLLTAGVAVAAHIFPFFVFPVLFFLFVRRRRHFNGPHYGHRGYGT